MSKEEQARTIANEILHELSVPADPAPKNLFTLVLEDLDLSEDQIDRVWAAIDEVCNVCWDDRERCYCNVW